MTALIPGAHSRPWMLAALEVGNCFCRHTDAGNLWRVGALLTNGYTVSIPDILPAPLNRDAPLSRPRYPAGTGTTTPATTTITGKIYLTHYENLTMIWQREPGETEDTNQIPRRIIPGNRAEGVRNITKVARKRH